MSHHIRRRHRYRRRKGFCSRRLIFSIGGMVVVAGTLLSRGRPTRCVQFANRVQTIFSTRLEGRKVFEMYYRVPRESQQGQQERYGAALEAVRIDDAGEARVFLVSARFSEDFPINPTHALRAV